MGKILEIKKQAKLDHIPIMQDEGIEFICDYIKQHQVKKILEIGTAVGYSAIMFANTDNDILVTTIEKDSNLYRKALENIKYVGLEKRIKVINEDALLSNLNDKYDLIFIDAAKGQYTKFFEKYKVNLKDDGVIISDNLSFHGMVLNPTLTHNRNTKQLINKIKKYIHFLEGNEEFTTKFYQLGDGISVSKKKPKC